MTLTLTLALTLTSNQRSLRGKEKEVLKNVLIMSARWGARAHTHTHSQGTRAGGGQTRQPPVDAPWRTPNTDRGTPVCRSVALGGRGEDLKATHDIEIVGLHFSALAVGPSAGSRRISADPEV